MDSHGVCDQSPIDLTGLFSSFNLLKAHFEGYVDGQEVVSTLDELLPTSQTLAHLGRLFQLSAFEQLIVVLTLAQELEPNFQGLFATVHGNPQQPYATLGLALSTLPEANWSLLSPQNPLYHWQLIHTEPGYLLTQSPIKIDRRILCYLLGEPALPDALNDLVNPLPAETLTQSLSPAYQAIAQQIIAAWSAASPHQPFPLLCLTGSDATTNRTVALQVCDTLGFQLMEISVATLPTHPPDLKQLQRQWEREAILSNCVLLLDGDGFPTADQSREIAISLFLETLSTPAIVMGQGLKPRLNRSLLTFAIPSLPHDEQTTLWRTHLGIAAADLDGYVNVLATQFKLTPTAIQTICSQAKFHASLDPAAYTTGSIQNPQPATIQNHLWTLCRQQARPHLDDLAQRIDATATWDDLVLPDRQLQILRDIATHLTYRAQVYQTWGFAQKGSRGLGISALFYGDSGTGKTMAAEVLARACELDLYRIDLSAVVSKYIGETEKNLRRIFDAAEAGGVILLFDEADALFGKRTEIKDSHDRHANIEVSYLLQRMEAYQGLAILTSNLKTNLDQAFLRRLRFIVPFPFPDEEARSQIWRRMFPAQTPTQGLDFARLGQLKVAGGNIYNIALNTAFLAAQENQPVTMAHIEQAAQQDYLKLEKLLTLEELKGWDI
jgi:hypothetical protein